MSVYLLRRAGRGGDLVRDAAWRAAIAAGLRAYPRAGDEAALVAHVEAAITAGARLAHADELVLAWAVGRGDPDAVRAFERLVADDVGGAARKIDRAASFVDEIAQRVRIRLVTGDGDAPPRIASYRGAGPLRGWVGVVALRVALNAKREHQPHAGDDLLADVVDREPDPELRHMKTLYRAAFRAALTDALAALTDRERALLRLRFVDGLELAPIARLYAVHASTVSRWIADALATVGKGARTRLVARLQLAPSGIESIARMVESQLDLSIGRLLQ